MSDDDEDEVAIVDSVRITHSEETTATRIDVDRLLSDVGAFGRYVNRGCSLPSFYSTSLTSVTFTASSGTKSAFTCSPASPPCSRPPRRFTRSSRRPCPPRGASCQTATTPRAPTTPTPSPRILLLQTFQFHTT